MHFKFYILFLLMCSFGNLQSDVLFYCDPSVDSLSQGVIDLSRLSAIDIGQRFVTNIEDVEFSENSENYLVVLGSESFASRVLRTLDLSKFEIILVLKFSAEQLELVQRICSLDDDYEGVDFEFLRDQLFANLPDTFYRKEIPGIKHEDIIVDFLSRDDLEPCAVGSIVFSCGRKIFRSLFHVGWINV
jgi:hypothetical protein